MKSGIQLVEAKVRKNMVRFASYNNGPFHERGQLKSAAIFTLTGDLDYYPSDWENWYRDNCIMESDPIEEMVNTCALLIAEIDRLQIMHYGL